MVAMTVFSIIMVVLFQILAQTQIVWGNTRSQLGQFREARTAFEMMTRRLADASLNPYWDYEYPGGDKTKTPTRYVRQSELHFLTGAAREEQKAPGYPALLPGDHPGHAIFFQGPFGFHDPSHWEDFNVLLNSWGYFVEFGADLERPDRPTHASQSVVRPAYRFRLMELRVPAESTRIYEVPPSGDPSTYLWYREPAQPASQFARPIADNVISLIIMPMRAPDPTDPADQPWEIAPNYFYDTRGFQHLPPTAPHIAKSRHQLPPLLRVTMIALDEASAARLEATVTAGEVPDFSFADSLFQDASKYEDDLAEFETELLDRDLRYRVFSTTLKMRNSKWSVTD